MKIIFLCVANSARSQMAEGLARALAHPDVQILSAGSQPSQVNPFAILALKEWGIDISQHASKSTTEVDFSDADFVITLCADEACPLYIGLATKLHWPFEDPAGVGHNDEEKLSAFRRIRDQIHAQLTQWLMEREILCAEIKFARV